ncbi:cytochrome c biogenesis protein CcsA [Ferrovum sp. PN-J185]|uniref:cytochrome C assembly family protein n=1 Tax=Ferrovum sp. PN-J185 TaxID=1356306 RepID=UPI001E5B5364|nr:cytochrome c biogenesis protein CcsA [Ferrovum sp. PN-J185]MCC6068845.1 cytochrome c biogenesis protein CcsA [Ferrovum sp. PN-J185]
MITSEYSFYFITAFLYLMIGIRDWLSFNVTETKPEQAQRREWSTRLFLLVAWFTHVRLIHQTIMMNNQLDFSIGPSLSLLAATTVAMYWLIGFRHQMGLLRPVILFLAIPGVLAPLIFTQEKAVNYTGIAFKVHVMVSLMAYSLFGIATIHALFIRVLEKRIHSKVLARISRWPSLVAMDAILFQMLWIGFVFLTITLISGVFFSEDIFGKPLVMSHKIVFSILSWVIYATLLVGRIQYGWRGRKAAFFVESGFVMLVLAYVGSKFVLEVLLHRS